MIVGFIVIETPEGELFVPVTAEQIAEALAATEAELQRELASILN